MKKIIFLFILLPAIAGRAAFAQDPLMVDSASLFLDDMTADVAEAPASPKGLSPETPMSEEGANYDPNLSRHDGVKNESKTLPGGFVKMSGKYRLAAGVNNQFETILNQANADLQERNFRYIFGEKQNNTFDPGIYQRYLLNLDFKPAEKISFYTQIVADPWSWVGTTGEQVQRSDIGGEIIRYNLKYFGAFNSTINEIYRTNVGDSVAFPLIKVNDGHTEQTTVRGFYDFNPATGGIPFTIPELDIDYEFRPFRKMWMDYTEDQWHARIFALADETQALTTDDPLMLSNHKSYWQQSPWLYQYEPVQHFTDGSIKRGFYSDSLSFLARDSDGNRLVLLRGASIEADMGSTYFAATIAAPYTPWDDHYFDFNNIPAAVRLKHQISDKLMVGSVYTFRGGLIDDSIADNNQVLGVDLKYNINDHVVAKAEMAGSYRERELLSDERFHDGKEGFAYKAEVNANFEHRKGETDFHLSYTQMGKDFEPSLSRYTSTRDDSLWGKHLTFTDYSPDLEAFRIGDGADINRAVVHMRWKEKWFKERFVNLFDVRNVHKTDNSAYKETVIREEVAYKFTPYFTGKGMFRWQGMPRTTPNIEPFLANYYFIGYEDPASLEFQNTSIPADQVADRYTYSGGFQYLFKPKWTGEGFVEITNDLSDFPRGLLNGTFRDANSRIDGMLTDHLTNFLYGQGPFGGVPPYEYATIFRERIIYKYDDKTTFTFHAAQNAYKFATGIDDNVNHQGISVSYDYSKKLNFFMDYTHSNQVDVARLIATNYTETAFDSHHNVYASMDYKVNLNTVFRAEYGVFGLGTSAPVVTPYSVTSFSLPTIDTEHLLRVSLNGDF